MRTKITPAKFANMVPTQFTQPASLKSSSFNSTRRSCKFQFLNTLSVFPSIVANSLSPTYWANWQLQESLFVEIEAGESLVIGTPDNPLRVTAIDANHCPGAVMFMFEGEFGNLLHTGDSRLTPECLQMLPTKYLSKRGKKSVSHLDYVFLDCTFAGCPLEIPSKHSAIRQVINCIWKHPDAPAVYLICDQLGHEEILIEVSVTFGSKIFINKTKNKEYFHVLSLIAPHILSEDPSSRFQIFEGDPQFYGRANCILTESRANGQPEPLFLRPSVQWYACERNLSACKKSHRRLREAERDQYGVWHVCYSMHSSKMELEWALELLQPKRVVSTTPSCRAIELDYVKKTCFSNQITAVDPLWKLLNIYPPVDHSSQNSSLLETEIYQEIESKQIVSASSSGMTRRSQLSPPPKERPLTLFGAARLGLEYSDLLQMDGRHWTSFEGSSSQMSANTENLVEEKEVLEKEDVIIADREEISTEVREAGCVPCSVSHVTYGMESVIKQEVSVLAYEKNAGCENCLSSSMKKWYRSINAPIPRPLPSLTKQFNTRRRAKINYSHNLLYYSFFYSHSESVYRTLT